MVGLTLSSTPFCLDALNVTQTFLRIFVSHFCQSCHILLAKTSHAYIFTIGLLIAHWIMHTRFTKPFSFLDLVAIRKNLHF